MNRNQSVIRLWPPGWTYNDILEFGEVEVSTSDTIIFYNFHSTKPILSLDLRKKSDSTLLTYTNTGHNNVATVSTGGLVNERCYYLAHGYVP